MCVWMDGMRGIHPDIQTSGCTPWWRCDVGGARNSYSRYGLTGLLPARSEPLRLMTIPPCLGWLRPYQSTQSTPWCLCTCTCQLCPCRSRSHPAHHPSSTRWPTVGAKGESHGSQSALGQVEAVVHRPIPLAPQVWLVIPIGGTFAQRTSQHLTFCLPQQTAPHAA